MREHIDPIPESPADEGRAAQGSDTQEGMVQPLKTVKAIGERGQLRTREERQELALYRRAMRERWGVPKDIKEDVIATCADIIRGQNSTRDRLNAARVLVLCDSVDVRREAIDSAESRADTQAQVDALRAAMAQPGALDALAALSVSMAQPQAPQSLPSEPAPQAPETGNSSS